MRECYWLQFHCLVCISFFLFGGSFGAKETVEVEDEEYESPSKEVDNVAKGFTPGR